VSASRSDAQLASAFPASLRTAALTATAIMPAAGLRPASPFSVPVAGESVAIPYRLYHDEPAVDAEAALSPVARTALHCLYTRHHDGRVRQRHLERVVASTEPWVVPFVVQLVGEYVVEILVAIQRGLAELDRPGSAQHTAYGRFLADNPDFLARTGQRVTSYWDCYYRSSYPDPRSYPGQTLLTAFRAAAAAHAGARVGTQ
jgi:hypothetical protein